MNKLADTILVPGVYVDVDNSIANTALGESFKTLIIGSRLSTGTVAKDTLAQVFSLADAQTKFGLGSLLANQFAGWFENNAINEVYGIGLDDDAAGVPADSEMTFTGTATEAGSIYTYIMGRRIVTAVASGDTGIVIGVAVAADINAQTDLPVTASAAIGIVTITNRNDGSHGNDIQVSVNEGEGEALPAGASVAIVGMASGTNNPDVTDAIAAVPDEKFDLIVCAYADTTNVGILTTELARRWGNTVQLDGFALVAADGTTATIVSYADSLNSEHLAVIDNEENAGTPPFLTSAQVGGQMAKSASVDPARPFRTLPVTGRVGVDAGDRRTFSELSSLLNSGTSTLVYLSDDSSVIDRMVTTYKTNAAGAPDNSYRNANTVLNLSFIRQAFKTRMLSRFPRHKLANDGDAFGAGQPIATRSSIKGEIIALYEELIRLGLVEDVDSFADSLVVERDAVNRSRVNVNMNPILVGQLYQFDATLQFIV